MYPPRAVTTLIITADRTDETSRALEQKREMVGQVQNMQCKVKEEQLGNMTTLINTRSELSRPHTRKPGHIFEKKSTRNKQLRQSETAVAPRSSLATVLTLVLVYPSTETLKSTIMTIPPNTAYAPYNEVFLRC